MQYTGNKRGIEGIELETEQSADAPYLFMKSAANEPAETFDLSAAFLLTAPNATQVPYADLDAQNEAVFDVNNVNDITTLSRDELIAVQQELSAQGLYVTDESHGFYNDGTLGSSPNSSVTMHGFKLLQNGEEFANAHLDKALDDNDLSSTDTMKMQASLNEAGFGTGEVTGDFDAATAKSVIAYAKENDIAVTDLGVGVQQALRNSMGEAELTISLNGMEGADDFLRNDTQSSITSMLQEAWNKFTGNNSAAAPLLDKIAKHESYGGNYNIAYGGVERDFTSMSIKEVRDWQDSYVASGSASSAVGKFQIIRKTLDKLTDDMGLTGDELFDEKMQTRMGEELLKGRGLDSYLSGNMSEMDFLHNVSKEWAAVPDPYKGGASHYAGVGNNQSLTSVDSMLVAMRQIKNGVPSNVIAQNDAPNTTVASNNSTLDLG